MEQKIPFTCTNCEADVRVSISKMYVVVYSGDGSGHLSCTCPDCAFDNYKEVDDRTVELLVISGMKRVASTVPRIKPDVYLDEVNDFSKVPEADLFRRITEGDPST